MAGMLVSVLVVTGCQRGSTQSGDQQVTVSKRGPGMKQAAVRTLQLPDPRTSDLRHVTSKGFAAALGNDPVRIFEFVRDAIAYEAYVGVLRGPEGTLLALAGNSADRAMLLATLFQQAGQQVRFVRGTLPDREARNLVSSMWAPRADPSSPQVPGEISESLKVAADGFAAATSRDFTLVRDQLKGMTPLAGPALSPTVEELIAEARPHYWIQWAKEGGWVDLDPSFSDATPGRTYGKNEETLAALPDALFHRVSVRVRVEELTNASPVARTLLTFEGKAAGLWAGDPVLVHQPENWSGPGSSVPGAIAAAIEETGRLKPVLLIGEDVLIGEPFVQKVKTAGLGGVPSLLRGDARTASIAVAEWVEFDFIDPSGNRESITRELFDLVGKAARSAQRPLNREEILSRTQGDRAIDMSRAVYSLLLTTGRIDTAHFSQLAEDPAPREGVAPDIRKALRRMSVAFAAASDGLLQRLDRSDGTAMVFFPDTPRLVITELSALSGIQRIAIDLRRNRSRAVAIGPHPEDVFVARLLRGVMDGNLERMLIEQVTAELRAKQGWPGVLSTSTVFDQVRAERLPFLLLPRDKDRLSSGETHEGLVRVREEVDQGYLAVVPQRPVTVSGLLRFAWWRVDPRSGETTGVTDDGLHQGVELHIEHNKSTGETTITWREFVGSAVNLATTQTVSVATGSLEMGRFLGALLTAARVIREIVNR